jgi:SAM-dependent methyltransferase
MIKRLWDLSAVYRAWQLPFEGQKFAPVARFLQDADVRSVLDVGCGPGTNAAQFVDTRYVGIDLNPAYIKSARRRFGDRFVVGDAGARLPESGAPYDVVLVNSLLHHLDDDAVTSVLRAATALLTPDGAVHVLDLELPAERSVARFLALNDRGDHVRTRDSWLSLLGAVLRIETFEPYPLAVAGRPLWNMFYARGSARARGLPATRR